MLKPGSWLWAATPTELYSARDVGGAIVLEDDLALAACELTGAQTTFISRQTTMTERPELRPRPLPRRKRRHPQFPRRLHKLQSL